MPQSPYGFRIYETIRLFFNLIAVVVDVKPQAVLLSLFRNAMLIFQSINHRKDALC